MAVKLLRGNSTTRASSQRVLEDGQPLYEKDTHKLYVGDGTTQAKNLSCITTDLSKNATNIQAKNGQYESLATALLEMVYPIGSIYMSVNPANPANFLGGTWERWGQGRVPVGVDENDTDKIFEEAGKEGGQKNTTLDLANLPEHYHTIGVNKYDGGRRLITTWISGVGTTTFTDWKYSSTPVESSTILTRSYSSTSYNSAKTNVAGSSPTSPISNLQPYITCYMWKRTA